MVFWFEFGHGHFLYALGTCSAPIFSPRPCVKTVSTLVCFPEYWVSSGLKMSAGLIICCKYILYCSLSGHYALLKTAIVIMQINYRAKMLCLKYQFSSLSNLWFVSNTTSQFLCFYLSKTHIKIAVTFIFGNALLWVSLRMSNWYDGAIYNLGSKMIVKIQIRF